MGTAVPTAGHLPTTMQMAKRAQVPALSLTISRMLTKVLQIGRSGRKGTCKGQEVLCQLCLEGPGWAQGCYWPMEGHPPCHSLEHPATSTLGTALQIRISGCWAFLATAWQQALAEPAVPGS